MEWPECFESILITLLLQNSRFTGTRAIILSNGCLNQTPTPQVLDFDRPRTWNWLESSRKSTEKFIIWKSQLRSCGDFSFYSYPRDHQTSKLYATGHSGGIRSLQSTKMVGICMRNPRRWILHTKIAILLKTTHPDAVCNRFQRRLRGEISREGCYLAKSLVLRCV